MPRVDELYTTAKAAAPGWSYVVDAGYDPSKAPINPTNRKRQRTGNASAIDTNDSTDPSELSLRQQTAVQRHFAELDRDNHKTAHVPLPAFTNKARKQTTNVKRILQSGKDFAYNLQEQEALDALRGPNAVPHSTIEATTTSGIINTEKSAPRASKTPIARRKSAAPQSAITQAVETQNASSTPSIMAGNVALSARNEPAQRNELHMLGSAPPAVTASEAEIEALLSAPPLTYAMARSDPPSTSAPRQRVFCEICGYWGRVKCMKCGARICGITCKATHDESRCVKFYA